MQFLGLLGRKGSSVVLLHTLAKDQDLSIPGQLHFDNVPRRFVHPAMLPRRVKDVGVATAGPDTYPLGLVVVPFLDLPDSAEIEGSLLRLSLGDGGFRESGIAASGQSGEQNQKERKEPKKPQKRFAPIRSGKTAQLKSPPAGLLIPVSIRIVKNKQSNNACHQFCRHRGRVGFGGTQRAKPMLRIIS